MNFDMVIAGVGGQGVVSAATIISKSALRDGFFVRQSEEHGMAQRGGAVQAQVRIADHTIESDLVSRGSADCILGLEPLEGLRAVSYLKNGGRFITSLDTVPIASGYPDEEYLRGRIAAIPGCISVQVKEIAREAGAVNASNVVLVGMASVYLTMIARSTFETVVAETFAAKGETVVAANLRAFRAGRCRAG